MESDNQAYLNGLSETEWDEAEAVESEIENLLTRGLSENIAIKFVRAVVNIRKIMPEATVAGIFEVAMDAGLTYTASPRMLDRLRQQLPVAKQGGSIKARSNARKNKVRGV